MWVLDQCNLLRDDTGCEDSLIELARIVSVVVSNIRGSSDQFEYNAMYIKSEFRTKFRREMGVRVTDDFLDAMAEKCDELVKDLHFTSDSLRKVAATYSP